MLALGEAQVYKCKVAGKIVYQASPCAAGTGAVLSFPTGPSEQEVRDAQARAAAEKAGAAAFAPAAKRAEAPQPSVSGAYCADLSRQHAQLVREAQQAARAERRFGGGGAIVIQGSDPIEKEFAQLEAKMRKANCALPN